jgi:hypothetical protein
MEIMQIMQIMQFEKSSLFIRRMQTETSTKSPAFGKWLMWDERLLGEI